MDLSNKDNPVYIKSSSNQGYLKDAFQVIQMMETKLANICVLSEVILYNPREKKIGLRTISGFFIRYFEKWKMYRCYCSSNKTRIVESRNAKFLKNDLICETDHSRDITLNKTHYEVELSRSSDRPIVIHTSQVQISISD